MKKMILALILGLAGTSIASAAEPSSDAIVRWKPATWQQAELNMPIGNPAHGEKLHHTLFCISCHGAKGESTTDNWPSLAGQRAPYLYKQLLDYKSHLRDEDGRSKIMETVAKLLTKQEMADLAAFYAEQPLSGNLARQTSPALVRVGDPKRLITPCASCHGAHGQGGINETSALVGQPKNYLLRSLENFRNGKRHNDVDQGMSQFAEDLSDKEIEMLANYYSSAAPSAVPAGH